MALVDLNDAYYTVPIHEDHQKCLKFIFKGKLYQYTCLPTHLRTHLRNVTRECHHTYKSRELITQTDYARITDYIYIYTYICI